MMPIKETLDFTKKVIESVNQRIENETSICAISITFM